MRRTRQAFTSVDDLGRRGIVFPRDDQVVSNVLDALHFIGCDTAVPRPGECLPLQGWRQAVNLRPFKLVANQFVATELPSRRRIDRRKPETRGKKTAEMGTSIREGIEQKNVVVDLEAKW